MSSCSPSCARSEPARGAARRPAHGAAHGASRASAFLALASLLALAAASMARAADGVQAWALLEERWYRLALAGSRCGWLHEKVERSGDLVRSSTWTQMTVGRMGQGITLRSHTAFEETARGEPRRVEIRKESGAAPVTSTWTFGPAGIEIAEEQGGRRTTQVRPLPPEGWLTPRAADEFVRRRLAADAKEIAYVTVEPESGPDAVRIRSSRVGAHPAEVGGRTVTLTEWSTQTSLLERPTKDFYSADGVLVRSVTDLGVGVLESELSNEAEATAAVQPVEVMARTFIEVGPAARALTGSRRAELVVRARDGRLGDLPSAGAQAFARVDAGSAAVTVDASRDSAAADAERADPRFARASVVADSDDPEVRALARRATAGSGPSASARAEALRAAAFRHISRKDLASGFATASEAVRSRAGDCTEHAVLLCALLRSEGIPARVATGLLFVPDAGTVRDAYGWHMWTQALIDGRWVDLDAVLPVPGPRFDGSHLMTGASAADGASLDADLARIVDLMGDTVIEVRSIDGRPVAPAARPGTPAAAPGSPAAGTPRRGDQPR